MRLLGRAETVEARKTLSLVPSGDYYESVATQPHRDFGNYHPASEDFHFNSTARQVAVTRLRREVRNNPYLAGLVSEFPRAMGNAELRARSSSQDWNNATERWWYRWRKRMTRTSKSLRGLQRLVWPELLQTGEMFAVQLANGRVQLIASEYCGSPHTGRMDREANGVIYTENGIPRAYRFGRMTEAGMIDYSDGAIVSARDVRHLYDQDRVQMGRGIPWLLASLPAARDLYEITRAKTKQIKDANKFTGTIESALGEEALGRFAKPFDAENDDAADRPGKEDASEKGPVVLELRDGTFVALDPGEKLNLLQTTYQATDYKELIMLMLHAVASPVGLPVEFFFSGLGKINFSGFKGLGAQWGNRRDHYGQWFEEEFLNPLAFWRLSKAIKEGDIAPHPDGDLDQIEWAWRNRAVLDEEREAKSNAEKLKSGEWSLADVWERRGEYADEVLRKRRALYSELWRASRPKSEVVDDDELEVPMEFLLYGRLGGGAAESVQVEEPVVGDTDDEDDEEED